MAAQSDSKAAPATPNGSASAAAAANGDLLTWADLNDLGGKDEKTSYVETATPVFGVCDGLIALIPFHSFPSVVAADRPQRALTFR